MLLESIIWFRLGEQHDTDLGMPETISINGRSCLSRGSFVLYE